MAITPNPLKPGDVVEMDVVYLENPTPPKLTWREIFMRLATLDPARRVAEWDKYRRGRVPPTEFFKMETEERVAWLEEHWPL